MAISMEKGERTAAGSDLYFVSTISRTSAFRGIHKTGFPWRNTYELSSILISIPSLTRGMSIYQFSGLGIMAVIAVFVLTVTVTITVSIAQISQENEQEAESGELAQDFSVTPDNQGENTTRPIGNINITQGNTTDLADDEYEFE